MRVVSCSGLKNGPAIAVFRLAANRKLEVASGGFQHLKAANTQWGTIKTTVGGTHEFAEFINSETRRVIAFSL